MSQIDRESEIYVVSSTTFKIIKKGKAEKKYIKKYFCKLNMYLCALNKFWKEKNLVICLESVIIFRTI